MRFRLGVGEDVYAKPSRTIARVLVCGASIFQIMGWASGDLAAQPNTSLRRVLVLYSDERLLPANVIADEAIRGTFAAESSDRFEFHSEFLDVTRFPGEEQQQRERDFLRERYRDRAPDLVIAGGGPALGFLLKYRAGLFSDVPIVHCGVEAEALPKVMPDANVAGIPMPQGAVSTLELALHLQPDARHVVVVAGSSPRDFEIAEQVRRETSSVADRVTFSWLVNLSLADLRAELSRLPANTVVLYLTMFQDGTGASFTPRQALASFAPASRAPIYGCYATYLGHGILGGSMVTFEEVGRKTAKIGMRILAGEESQSAARSESLEAKPMFDWRQLRRWNIDEQRLPPGSVTLFREPSYWEQHRRIIIAAISLCALEAVLIGTLVVQLRRRRLAERLLRESEQRMSLATAAANLGIWIQNLTGNEIWATDKWRELFGFEKWEWLDMHCFLQRIHPEDRDTVSRALAQARESSASYEQEYRIILPDGRVRWITSRGRIESDQAGKPIFMRGVSVDNTARKLSEKALQESEARFRTMANTTPVMIWMSDIDKLCVFFNKVWLDFTGRKLEEELGDGWTAGIHPEDVDRCLKTYIESFEARREFSMDYRLRRSDGEYRWVLDNGVPRFASEGTFLGYIGSAIDITERRAAEAAAHDLSGRLIRAQEEEQSRLARELHDDLSQSLAMLSIELEMFGRHPPREAAQISDRVQHFSEQINRLSSEVHRLSHELHPAKLEQLGLVAAVRGFCKEFGAAHQLAIEFADGSIPRVLPADTALCLYRIVQESLHNVVRHSRGTAARVNLTVDRHELCLAITDNGIGFAPAATRANGSLGLVTMGERARFVRGRLSIESRPGQGTRIEVRVPRAAAEDLSLSDQRPQPE
jgi:PAS domain S-box-containing protein